MGVILNGRFIGGVAVGVLALWLWNRYRASRSGA